MGGGKRTRERALPRIFGPLQNSLWSALSWILYRKNRALTPEGGGRRTVQRGVQNPFLGGVSFVRFSYPLFFHPPKASSEPNCFPLCLCLGLHPSVCSGICPFASAYLPASLPPSLFSFSFSLSLFLSFSLSLSLSLYFLYVSKNMYMLQG